MLSGKGNGQVFLNLFSANDPQSTRMLLERYLPDPTEAVLLYNNRGDRPDRLLLFARHFLPHIRCRKVLVMGEARALACRLLRRSGLPVEAVRDWRAALASAEGAPVVGIGNIKGQASEMVCPFEEGGSDIMSELAIASLLAHADFTEVTNWCPAGSSCPSTSHCIWKSR